MTSPVKRSGIAASILGGASTQEPSSSAAARREIEGVVEKLRRTSIQSPRYAAGTVLRRVVPAASNGRSIKWWQSRPNASPASIAIVAPIE